LAEPPGYSNELMPRDEDGNVLYVYVNVTILAFPDIDTAALKYTVDYFLSMRWFAELLLNAC